MEDADNHVYHAYAPDPIVFDTIRNGTLTGSGASCECGTPLISKTTGGKTNSTSVNQPMGSLGPKDSI